ncbi:hypothetical protein Dda_6556 [Drechslerella dactyloides]|uniref:Tail specific protease domain-containing protein n=1 Tax=Drechslerella dactyloides TaxID=74499 RepID=A0AAD6ITQ6_DREDA|nr:hypothetical protein Dda_6556 [Drechslerella dactyloides]
MRAAVAVWLLGAANLAAAVYIPVTNATVSPTQSRPTPTAYTPSEAVFNTACAQVSASYASALATYSAEAATNTSAVAPTSVPVRPRELWDCLYSIPVSVDLSLEFIKQFAKYMQFQSTIEYLKNPPEGSLQDPIDILGSLEALAEQIASGEIVHHIKFEYAIVKLLQRCHDGHLGVSFNSAQLVAWQGPFSLVSVSVDGVAKPQVYVQDDVKEFGMNASYITRIDGYDVQAWLAEYGDFSNAQSPDARYNSIFARYDPPAAGTFFTTYGWYPGKNSISITFSNSSTNEYDYLASATWTKTLNWTGINDGTDFYQKVVLNKNFFNETATTAYAAKRWAEPTPAPVANHALERLMKRSVTTSAPASTETSEGTPEQTETLQLVFFNGPFMEHRVGPYVRDLNNILGGYFLNDTLETGVLDISSFAAADEEAPNQNPGFRAALTAFLDEVRRRKTKKLIIDLRGNGGGLVNLGFELYKQLFPAAPAKSYYRIRAHGAAQIFASVADEIASEANVTELVRFAYAGDNATSELSEAQIRLINTQLQRGFSRQDVLDVKDKPVKDLETWIGGTNPPGYNDSVSLVVQTILDYEFEGISGFGELANFTSTPQPFQKPDILILSDGTCASTCTIFSELLKREQPGISTIVVGGRPNDAPSAHVGGTHGSRVLHFANLFATSNDVLTNFPPSTPEREQLYDLALPYKLPLGLVDAAINFRDAIRPEDETQTPLQFKLEPADCRLYYTESVFQDSINLWGELAELKWGTKSNFTGCAVGGLQNGQASTGAVPDDPDAQNIANWVMKGLDP